MILMLVCSRYGYEQRVSTNSRPAPPASNSSQYERRVEKYERHEQPASSRYTERRASHETVHRDRDDRSRVAETRAPKYDRCVFTLCVNLKFSFPVFPVGTVVKHSLVCGCFFTAL